MRVLRQVGAASGRDNIAPAPDSRPWHAGPPGRHGAHWRRRHKEATLRLQSALAWLALGLTLACVERARPGTPPEEGSPSEPAGRIPDVTRDTGVYLATPALRYRLRRDSSGYAVDIPYSYVNPLKRAVYLPACRADRLPPPPILEQQDSSGRWWRAWLPDNRTCQTTHWQPLVMRPGEVFADTLRLRAPFATDSLTAFLVDPAQGVYRMEWRVLMSYDTTVSGYGTLLDLSQRISNRFVLDPP